MDWKQEYEHWRDMGHTWGPGIDDVLEYSEEELMDEQARYEAYKQKIQDYAVAPRKEYLEAGMDLKNTIPSREDISSGNAPYNWRETYSRKAIDLCRQATESLGYRFCLMDHDSKKEDCFAVGVDYYGWLPERGGNIHRYVANDIRCIEDCLQLVSDFAAIGKEPTTYFGKDFHYSTKHSGELRAELERWSKSWNVPLPSKVNTEIQSGAMLEDQNQELEFIFDDEMMVSDDLSKLEGYLCATSSLVARLKDQESQCLTQNELELMENINFYPVYDIANNTVSLEGHYYHYSDDGNYLVGKGFSLPLSPDESARLMADFESYCKKTYGMPCISFLNDTRMQDGKQPLPQKSLADQIQSAEIRAQEHRPDADEKAKEIGPEI